MGAALTIYKASQNSPAPQDPPKVIPLGMACHHTFFEMLGSWSFGDYFKLEAIEYAYDLLTNVYGIDKERLYATYFGGDEMLGLDADLEARDYWLKYLPEERVIGCSAKDNFWEVSCLFSRE